MMDSATAWPFDLIPQLTDPDISLRQNNSNTSIFRHADPRPISRTNIYDDETFQASLQLKRTLDKLDNTNDRHITSNLQHLAALLNCEYRLFKLNAATPLRYNPFLSHWVETVRSEQKHGDVEGTEVGRQEEEIREGRGHDEDVIGAVEVRRTRVDFVKAILTGLIRTPEVLEDLSPRSIYETFRTKTIAGFNIDQFVRILEEEGIYEKAAPSGGQHDTDGYEAAIADEDRYGASKYIEELKHNPELALNKLISLPVEIRSLEIINILLFNGHLELFDPANIIGQFIQHVLREAESMDDAPAASAEAPTDLPVHREQHDQARIARLLVLFIKNLVRKGAISPDQIYFEIQELCVRYIWVKEVRDFRNLVEAGVWDPD